MADKYILFKENTKKVKICHRWPREVACGEVLFNDFFIDWVKKGTGFAEGPYDTYKEAAGRLKKEKNKIIKAGGKIDFNRK